MIKPLFTESELDQWFDIFEENAEAAFYEKLQEAGEMFVKLARESGSYQDQTGNLRSSIGYVIVKDRNSLKSNFSISGKGDNPDQGKQKAQKLAAEIAEGIKGFVLIGVAGMEYAVHVEAKGFEVISASSLQTEIWLKKSIQTIFKLAS